MTDLYELAREAEYGDRIRWVGEDAEVEFPEPRTVQKIVHDEDGIHIEAEGPQGGRARFTVDKDSNSTAWFGQVGEEENMGAVDKAELVDKNISIEPWPEP